MPWRRWALVPEAEAGLVGVLDRLLGQGQGLAQPPLIPQQAYQIAGHAGGEAVIAADGGLVESPAQQGFGLSGIHPRQDGGQQAKVLRFAGSSACAVAGER